MGCDRQLWQVFSARLDAVPPLPAGFGPKLLANAVPKVANRLQGHGKWLGVETCVLTQVGAGVKAPEELQPTSWRHRTGSKGPSETVKRKFHQCKARWATTKANCRRRLCSSGK